jgi:rhamnulose-1-phosphate aldolase
VETSKLMEKYDVAIWAHHGIFCAGTDFDNTFGLMHTVEKSAQIYLNILHSGKPILQTITDEYLLAIEKDFKITLNHEFLG